MDIQVKKNRENLYKSLISQGFFVDDNGEPELTVDEFGEQVSDEENVIALYENLIDAEVLVDANGNPLMSQEDFLLQILGRYAQRDFIPLPRINVVCSLTGRCTEILLSIIFLTSDVSLTLLLRDCAIFWWKQ